MLNSRIYSLSSRSSTVSGVMLRSLVHLVCFCVWHKIVLQLHTFACRQILIFCVFIFTYLCTFLFSVRILFLTHKIFSSKLVFSKCLLFPALSFVYFQFDFIMVREHTLYDWNDFTFVE